MLYLDHAATTPLRPSAWEAMESYRDVFGNPSGVHGVSRAAKNALEEGREKAALLIGADRPQEIVFTGGGTEADNLAITGASLAGGARAPVVVSGVEHKAVLEAARFVARLGARVDVIPVDSLGTVDPGDVVARVGPDTAVVSVMLANNETGTRQAVAEIARSVKAVSSRALVHTDAVQAFVSESIDVNVLGVDLLSLAAHKFGGPKGVGLLYVRDGVRLKPVLQGGSQEQGRRGGTHNLMGVAGMVAAMEETVRGRDDFRSRVAAIRDEFEANLAAEAPEVCVNGSLDRLVQHSNVRFPGHDAETLLVLLDQAGLAAAAGSACQSGALEPSHVLAAMGLEKPAAAEALRFSFGWTSEADDGRLAAKLVADVLRERS